jgi:hypothetical protein
MDAKQAADFLRISESEFKRMAPGLPRHAVTEATLHPLENRAP